MGYVQAVSLFATPGASDQVRANLRVPAGGPAWVLASSNRDQVSRQHLLTCPGIVTLVQISQGSQVKSDPGWCAAMNAGFKAGLKRARDSVESELNAGSGVSTVSSVQLSRPTDTTTTEVDDGGSTSSEVSPAAGHDGVSATSALRYRPPRNRE